MIEVEGRLVEASMATSLMIYPGQRYSILLTADQPIGNYWMRISMEADGVSHDGLAILRYGSAPEEDPVASLPLADVAPLNEFSLKLRNPHPVPQDVDKRIIFDVSATATNWELNGVAYSAPAFPPLLDGYLRGNKYTRLAQIQPVEISLGDVIEVVVNSPFLNHPMHLHGHSFWVVGAGAGFIGPDNDTSSLYNLIDPVVRDTVNVPDTGLGGWVAIRFVANNPGAWLFHCHILTHAVAGMATIFMVEPEEISTPPSDYPMIIPFSVYNQITRDNENEDEGPRNEMNFIFSGMIPAEGRKHKK